MAWQNEISLEGKGSAIDFSGTSTMHASVTPLEGRVGVARNGGPRRLHPSGKRSSADLLVTRTAMMCRALEALKRCAVFLAARTTSGWRRKSGHERLRDLLEAYEEARHILIRRVEPPRAAAVIQYRSTRRILFNTSVINTSVKTNVVAGP